MASSLTINKFRSNNRLQMFDHDPGGTSAAVVTPDGGTTERWFDLQEYGGFIGTAMSSALTGAGMTLVEIVANTASDGSGTTVVIKDSGTVAADAVEDYVVQECSAIEVEGVGNKESTPVSLRYVALRITMANAADEAVVTYIGYDARWPRSGLTATSIA